MVPRSEKSSDKHLFFTGWILLRSGFAHSGSARLSLESCFPPSGSDGAPTETKHSCWGRWNFRAVNHDSRAAMMRRWSGIKSVRSCFVAEATDPDSIMALVDLQHNNLTSVPTDLLKHKPQLEELYLDANLLREVPRVSCPRLFSRILYFEVLTIGHVFYFFGWSFAAGAVRTTEATDPRIEW